MVKLLGKILFFLNNGKMKHIGFERGADVGAKRRRLSVI